MVATFWALAPGHGLCLVSCTGRLMSCIFRLSCCRSRLSVRSSLPSPPGTPGVHGISNTAHPSQALLPSRMSKTVAPIVSVHDAHASWRHDERVSPVPGTIPTIGRLQAKITCAVHNLSVIRISDPWLGRYPLTHVAVMGLLEISTTRSAPTVRFHVCTPTGTVNLARRLGTCSPNFASAWVTRNVDASVVATLADGLARRLGTCSPNFASAWVTRNVDSSVVATLADGLSIGVRIFSCSTTARLSKYIDASVVATFADSLPRVMRT